MKYNWDDNKLKKLLANDEVLLNKNYSDELQLEINSLKCALNIPVIKQLMCNTNNKASLVITSSVDYIFKRNFKNPNQVYSNLSPRDIIVRARKTMESNEKRYFNKLIKHKNFNMSDNKSETFYLPYHNDNLINVLNRGRLSDARNIMHEIAHAMYFKDLKYSELENSSGSYLKEVLPILNEMFFIDRLDKYDEIISEQNIFLSNYYEWYRESISCDSYCQSFVIAEYLFMLYKEDKNKFNYQYNLFKEKLKETTDENIVSELKIGSTDLLSSNDKYLILYKK